MRSGYRLVIIVSLFMVIIYIFINGFKQLPEREIAPVEPDTDEPIITTPAGTTLSNFVYTTIGLDPRYPVPPGDMGRPVEKELKDSVVDILVQDGIRTQGLNTYFSDLMSVRRRLPEIRDRWCREPGRYPANLPPTSIVIVFYNEVWSVLVRSVHSILDRTPANLIHEIVLVDDYSYLPHLKTQLQEYFARYEKVRIMRAPKRLGLMRARMFGAQNTTADLITFLDAHVEVTVGWLEALLDVVAQSWTTIALPTIDWIDEHNMKYKDDRAPTLIGAYDWDLNFVWWRRQEMKKKYQNKMVPFDTPAMAGGLFTINRTFFEKLGWYDEGFDIYGIENIELSMKSWMCGGKMVTVPCSRIGHIAKTSHPYLQSEKKDVIRANSIRLAEVWMDEYKGIIYDIYGIPHYLEEEFGSIENRKRIRERAGCRNFRYYIENAFPEMRNPKVIGAFRGEVHSVVLGAASCLEFRASDGFLGMAPCDGKQRNQFWTHNYYEELNSYRYCIDFSGRALGVFVCHRSRGSQGWHVLEHTGQIRNMKHRKCLALNLLTNVTLTMEQCDDKRAAQRWTLNYTHYDFTPFQALPGR